MPSVPIVKPLADRFWSRVRKTETCWIWEGGRRAAGYGVISTGGKNARVVSTHRVAWELTYGPVPAGRYLLHACDNPPCCNPSHLRLGTNVENISDWRQRGKGRATPRQGIPPLSKRQSLEERFWARVLKTDTCWLWQGQVNKFGHGTIGRGGATGRNVLVHRLSWELANGPIPEGGCLLHKCDTPPCVNPEHLFIGTRSDNMADKVSKGRQSRGERLKTARFKESQILEIRRRYENRDPRRSTRKWRNPDGITAIAEDYGTAVETIFDIVNRRTWAHLE